MCSGVTNGPTHSCLKPPKTRPKLLFKANYEKKKLKLCFKGTDSKKNYNLKICSMANSKWAPDRFFDKSYEQSRITR